MTTLTYCSTWWIDVRMQTLTKTAGRKSAEPNAQETSKVPMVERWGYIFPGYHERHLGPGRSEVKIWVAQYSTPRMVLLVNFFSCRRAWVAGASCFSYRT